MSIAPLERSKTPLVATVKSDDLTAAAIRPFDLNPDVPSHFYPFIKPNMPDTWDLGLIVGASGSGKSLLLKEFGPHYVPLWQPDYSITAHFESAAQAIERFYAVGLNSVPVWKLPFRALSNGQQFRANLARNLEPGAVIDEYTSVVDRNVAISASKALNGFVKRHHGIKLTLATCHRDVIEWLQPDWIIDTDSATYSNGLVSANRKWWATFAKSDAPSGGLTYGERP